MSKRLIKAVGGRGLYEIRDGFGTRQVWEPLPAKPWAEPPVDPAVKLLAQSAPKAPSLAGGLDGNPKASRDDERRRAADRVLKASGVR
jgi:hypothetical protein